MANKDFARGLWPVAHLTGGEISTHPYKLTQGQIIRKGELVKVITAGTVEDGAGSDGIILIGVSADYVNDSDSSDADYGDKTVNVYDDPNIIFGIQSITGDTPTIASNFKIADAVSCSLTGTENISDTELDADGGAATFIIIGKVPEVGNAWGEHADLMVIFNEHFMKGMTAAAASAGV